MTISELYNSSKSDFKSFENDLYEISHPFLFALANLAEKYDLDTNELFYVASGSITALHDTVIEKYKSYKGKINA